MKEKELTDEEIVQFLPHPLSFSRKQTNEEMDNFIEHIRKLYREGKLKLKEERNEK